MLILLTTLLGSVSIWWVIGILRGVEIPRMAWLTFMLFGWFLGKLIF